MPELRALSPELTGAVPGPRGTFTRNLKAALGAGRVKADTQLIC